MPSPVMDLAALQAWVDMCASACKAWSSRSASAVIYNWWRILLQNLKVNRLR